MGQESTKTVGDMQILWSFLGSWAFSVFDKLASSSSSKGGQWIPKKFCCASWLKDFETGHLGQLGVLGPSKGSSQAVSLGPSTPSPSLHTTPVDWGARERLGNKGGFHPEPAERGRWWRALQPWSGELSCDSELKNVWNFFLLGILHQAEPVLRETFHFTDPNGFPLCWCINETPAHSNQKEAMQIIAWIFNSGLW